MPVLLGAYNTFVQWLEAHLFACPFKKYLHVECIGCGLQRSVILLLKGDLPGSLRMYPATIPMIAMVVFLCLHLKYGFRHGATVIKYLQLGIAILIAVFYIYKIVNHKIAD